MFHSTDIRKNPNDEKTEEIDGLVSYIHELKTKYYSTEVALLPVDTTENLAEAVKGNVEGVLVYFDSNDVSFETKVIHVYIGNLKIVDANSLIVF